MKKMFLKLWNFAVVGKQKAVVAFFVTAISTYVAKHGWTLDHATLTNLVSSVVYGAIAHATVYWKTNK
ncbi:MAG: hypothetical protein ACREGB_00935, partial [Candidatus Saccharimonadales bacterium]